MSVFRPNPAQQARDTSGMRNVCASCGRDETRQDPLVLAGDGYRVHVAHVVTDQDNGYYGMPYEEAS